MDLDTRVKAPDGVLATEIDGEAVLMHTERGVYYGLNEVGTVIWRRLAQPVTVQELCDAVMEEFDVDAETCRRDVAAVVGRMNEAGLVETVD